MSGVGYTGHHINSVELGSLGQNGEVTQEILYLCLIVTILEELTNIYILIKGIEVAGPIWGAVGYLIGEQCCNNLKNAQDRIILLCLV